MYFSYSDKFSTKKFPWFFVLVCCLNFLTAFAQGDDPHVFDLVHKNKLKRELRKLKSQDHLKLEQNILQASHNPVKAVLSAEVLYQNNNYPKDNLMLLLLQNDTLVTLKSSYSSGNDPLTAVFLRLNNTMQSKSCDLIACLAKHNRSDFNFLKLLKYMWRKEDFLFVLETEIEEKPELKNILYQCFNDQAEIFFLFPLYKEIDEKALGNLLKSKSTDLINHLFQFDSNSKNLFRDLWDLKNYKPEYEPEIIKFLENYFFFGRMKGVDINNNIFKNELDISTHRLQKLKKDQPQEYQQAIKKIKEDPKYPDSLIEFAILNHPNL